MEEFRISDDAYEQLKDLRVPYARGITTKEQELLIDKLILNEELKRRYKTYGLCEYCKQPFVDSEQWCRPCRSKLFQQNFKNWTSGNRAVDELIQKSQLEANRKDDVLHWVEYNKLENVEYLAKGGFGTVYKAVWKYTASERVVLKYLHDSHNIAEFLREVELHHIVRKGRVIPCYGITKNPETNELAMVIEQAYHGSLRQHLDKSFGELGWYQKFEIWSGTLSGLMHIHKNGLIHCDFHSGNLLVVVNSLTYVCDLGLCRPINAPNEKVYGVLPYVAPEVLRGKEYTQKSDIYALGIIIYEVCTGLPPYHDIAHDGTLAIKICQGLRPTSNRKIPQLILDIIKQCWDPDPLKRPDARTVYEQFNSYWIGYRDEENTEFCRQAKETDEFNKQLPSITTSLPSNDNTNALSYTSHPQAVYTSRLLDFKNLPESDLISFNVGDDIDEDENND